jgi:hypothetical protein
MGRADGDCGNCVIASSFALGQLHLVNLRVCTKCQFDERPARFKRRQERAQRSRVFAIIFAMERAASKAEAGVEETAAFLAKGVAKLGLR